MKKYLPLFLVLLFGIIFSFQLLLPGFMDTHDGIWHTERVLSMSAMLKLGQFPVRWSFGLDNGFGLPVFNFVYPFPYYLMSILSMLGVGVTAVLKLTNFAFYLLGGVGVYFLFPHKNRFLSSAVAILYLLTPYQFLDIFVRGALGEVVVLGLIPWVLLSLKGIANQNKISWYSPIPLFLTLISHNFLGVLFLFLVLYLTIFVYVNKKKIIRSILISLGLAGFFLIPMIFERNLLLSAPPDLPNAQFDNHFVYAKQLLYSAWNYEGSLPGANNSEISYQLGLSNIFILILAIYFLLRKKNEPESILKVYLFAIFSSLFLTLSISAFIWGLFPPLKIIQFPWRLLAISAILIPYISYFAFSSVRPKCQNFIILLTIALAVINVWPYRHPIRTLRSAEFMNLHYAYAQKFASAYRYELTPIWAPNERSRPAEILAPGAGAELRDVHEGEERISFVAEAEEGSQVVIYRNYFPSWQVKIDGARQALEPAQDGSIILTLKEGIHAYELYLGSTFVQKLGNLTTIISFLVIIYLALYKKHE